MSFINIFYDWAFRRVGINCHAELVEARRRAAWRKAFYFIISNEKRNLLKRLSACIPNASKCNKIQEFKVSK